MHNAILINDNGVTPVEHALTLDALQESVGGWICPAFTVPSCHKGSRRITGYVDDEGLLKELPLTAVRIHPMGIDPLVGPMLVTGLDANTGDTVPLDAEEIQWFLNRLEIAVLRNRHETRSTLAIKLANFGGEQ
jgi:hypothetical protein